MQQRCSHVANHYAAQCLHHTRACAGVGSSTGGAIVLGKTNLHELSYGWTSNNLAFGAVHTPYDPQRIPGGSSGGTV